MAWVSIDEGSVLLWSTSDSLVCHRSDSCGHDLAVVVKVIGSLSSAVVGECDH